MSVASLQASPTAHASLLSLFFDDGITPGDCYKSVTNWWEKDQQFRSKMKSLRSNSVTFATTSGLLMRYRRNDGETANVLATFYECPGLSSAYLIATAMMSASMLTKNSTTDFSTFVTNAFSGTCLGEILLDAPPNS
jgi:hypothetical protein